MPEKKTMPLRTARFWHRAAHVQMPKELALRFCAAVEPYMASALSDWAAGSSAQDAETRSTALLQVCPADPSPRAYEVPMLSATLLLRAAGHTTDGSLWLRHICAFLMARQLRYTDAVLSNVQAC